METTTRSTQETQDLAVQIANKIKPGDVLALYGDLGSGKTTFTRFLTESLGNLSRVQSPTFVIARKYSQGLTIYHLDLYRIKTKEELRDLDIDQFFEDKDAVTVIEWPEIAEHVLPRNSIKIRFVTVDENSRKINVENLR